MEESPATRDGRRPARSRLLAAAALAGAVVIGATTAPPPAAATSNGAFSLQPSAAGGPARSVFAYAVRPGRRVEDLAVLRNLTSSTQTFELYAADAYDTAVGGTFALRARGQRDTGVGAWVRLATDRVTVPPHGSTLVPFVVDVPADAPPGDHAGGIVALDVAGSSERRGRVRLLVHNGVGIRVLVRVTGPLRPRFHVGSLRLSTSVPALSFLDGSSRALVRLPLADTGNTSLDVTVRLHAVGTFGRALLSFAPQHLTLLPGSRVVVSEPVWSPLPVIGPTVHLQATVRATQAGFGRAVVATRSASASFLDVPWALVAGVLALLGVAASVLVRRRKRRRAQLREPGAGALGDPGTAGSAVTDGTQTGTPGSAAPDRSPGGAERRPVAAGRKD